MKDSNARTVGHERVTIGVEVHPHPAAVIVLELMAVEDPLVRVHGHAFRRDADVRLRAALKLLLRCFGLKCVSVRNGAAGHNPEDSTPAPEGTHAA